MSWSLFEKSFLQSARPILQKAFSEHALENAGQSCSGRRLGLWQGPFMGDAEVNPAALSFSRLSLLCPRLQDF